MPSWIGSDQRQMVHLPTVLAYVFTISQSEARKLLRTRSVTIDGEVTQRQDIPVDDIEGRELEIGTRKTVTVERDWLLNA